MGLKIPFKEFGFWWAIWGGLATAIALINLVQHWTGIELIPLFENGLAVYRTVVHTLVGWLLWPFVSALSWIVSFIWPIKIVVPGWWKDLTAISMLLEMIAFRGVTLGSQQLINALPFLRESEISKREAIIRAALRFGLSVLFGLALLGLLFPIRLWAMVRYANFSATASTLEIALIFSVAFTQIACLIIALIASGAFFLLNEYAK